mgnify:CR=1 FL=1|jgi:hypothetical protein
MFSTKTLNLGNKVSNAGINSAPISSLICLNSAATALDWFAKLSEVLDKSPI